MLVSNRKKILFFFVYKNIYKSFASRKHNYIFLMNEYLLDGYKKSKKLFFFFRMNIKKSKIFFQKFCLG